MQDMKDAVCGAHGRDKKCFYACIYFLTHSLTPRSTVLLERIPSSQLVKKFPTFYGAWKFITMFTSAHHLSLSWARSIQSIPPHPTSWIPISILPSHLCLGLPSFTFPQVTPPILCMFLSSPTCAICPAHRILLDLITWIMFGEYRSLSSSLRSFLQSPVTSPLLGTNILLNTLFSNTLSLCSSLNVTSQVSHPYMENPA